MQFRIETDRPGYTVRIGTGSGNLVDRGVTPLTVALPEGRHLIQLVGWRDIEPRQRSSRLVQMRQQMGTPPDPTRQEVRTHKFIIAAASPAAFRTAYRQEKANTEAEKAAGWFDPMAMFMGVTAPSYGSQMSPAMLALAQANEPFTFVPFEEDASFGSAFPLGGFAVRPTAPLVEPSTDNSPVVLRWTVKDWVDKTEAKPVFVTASKAVEAVKAAPAAVSVAIETAKTEGVVEAAKQSPLVALVAGVGGTLGVLGLLKWLRGRSS